jgi:hypothetical protein
MLEERHSGFFGGLEIFFDQPTNDLSFTMTEIHGFHIGQSTSHVPAHFQCFISDGTTFFFHAIHDLGDAIRVRGQEADSKKRAVSRVKACSYLFWQLAQVMFKGLSSLASLSATA